MTKLKQQFASAGSVGTSSDRPSKGWTYKEQRAYKRNRFNNLKPIVPQMVFNHKVEQVARAIVSDKPLEGILHTTSPVVNNLHYGYELNAPVRIGKVVGNSASLFPDTNTALALLGLNGVAVLYWLGAMRVVDDITGQKGEVIVNDGEYIYTSVGVILQLAQDCVKNPQAILNNYQGAKRVRK